MKYRWIYQKGEKSEYRLQRLFLYNYNINL